MPEQPRGPQSLWKEQPEEKLTVNVQNLINRRTRELGESTRSEILVSIVATVMFVAIVYWRFPIGGAPFPHAGLAIALVWISVTAFRFRHKLLRPGDAGSRHVAATGAEYYRRELESRRDHLRNEWLWHGPLLLAAGILIANFAVDAFPNPERLRNIAPFTIFLAVWVVANFLRRRRHARELQREIDEIDHLS